MYQVRKQLTAAKPILARQRKQTMKTAITITILFVALISINLHSFMIDHNARMASMKQSLDTYRIVIDRAVIVDFELQQLISKLEK